MRSRRRALAALGAFMMAIVGERAFPAQGELANASGNSRLRSLPCAAAGTL